MPMRRCNSTTTRLARSPGAMHRRRAARREISLQHTTHIVWIHPTQQLPFTSGTHSGRDWWNGLVGLAPTAQRRKGFLDARVRTDAEAAPGRLTSRSSNGVVASGEAVRAGLSLCVSLSRVPCDVLLLVAFDERHCFIRSGHTCKHVVGPKCRSCSRLFT
jgi:hypothetical protein